MRSPKYNLDTIDSLKIAKSYLLMNKEEKEQFKALILDLYYLQENCKNKPNIETTEHGENKNYKQMLVARRSMYSRRELMRKEV